MAFNFFIRKKDVPEVVEPPKNNLIDADLLIIQIGLMHETYFSVAKTRAGKGEPRGYCRALKDIEAMVRDMNESGVAG